MTLASWRPRSWKVRLTAEVTLVAMLAASVRIAYAAPAPGTSPGSAAAKTGKLTTDTPWALATRLRPSRITVLDGSADASVVAYAFDERAETGLSAAARPARIRLDFERPSFIEAVAIWGKVDGALSVETAGPDGPAQLLARASLASGGAGWNRREFSKAPLASTVTVTFETAAAGASLRELEIWGRPKSAPIEDTAALLPDALYTGVPAGARELRGAPAEQTIALATVSGGIGGTFSVTNDIDPREVRRAFLVYELSGLPHFSAALRSLNGQRPLGRFGVSRGAKGGTQVEEIDPAALKLGANRVQFLPVDDHDPGSYRVRNLRLVAIPRGGAKLTDGGARAWGAVHDGLETTGWKAASAKPAVDRSWTFARVSQPWALDLRLPARGAGTLTIRAAEGGNRGQVTVKLDDLGAGWHRVPLAGMPATEALTMTLAPGREQAAEISELAIEGSPVPADEAPRLTVTYPLSGECVNGRVHVRGFVTPAGAETLTANQAPVAGALDRGGTFAFELPGKDAAGRDVVVEAAYRDGKRARQTVSIGGCVDRPPVVVADDGRPRQPVDDAGAPFGVTVKAGQAAVLAFDGVKLDIPEGAVEKDVRITIRPLPAKDVATLDSDMTNVTPSGKAFRFGPLGMLFKKPVTMTVPYDRKLIPAGMSGKDVRTFYYDETLHRWEQVGIVSQNDREMIVVSEHFTDFVNATMPMPDHPGTTSFNPTSLKDIKLADPAAGITRIAPPAASPSGSANLQFPIDVPPGRRGMQPSLALTYNSDRGNSWVGVGWDIQAPSIEVDTRFGVPRYQGEEVYLFNGAMLTPVTPVPNGPRFYRERDGGSFDVIERIGEVPLNFRTNCYFWKVTDKNGTVSIYGQTKDSRLYDSDLSRADRSNVSRWYLESVTDVFGNRMTYSYVRDVSPGGSAPAAHLYLDTIAYTSNANAGLAASFTVKFVRTAGVRDDAFTNARAGFLTITRQLLDHIDVNLGSNLIRRYNLRYEEGRFRKKLLTSIAMVGTDGTTQLYAYRFDYRGAVPDDEHALNNFFTQPVVWGQLRNQQGTNMSLRPEYGLSTSNGDMDGLNVSAGIRLPFGIFHARVGGGVTGGSDSGHMSPFDMNGDGLPDFIDDTTGINLNSLIVTGVNPTRFGLLSSEEVSAPLSHTNRSGWNLEGEVGTGFNSNLGFGVGVSVDGQYARTSAEDNRIVTDLDADGYPDIVQLDDKGKATFYRNHDGTAFVETPNFASGLDTTSRSVTVAQWNSGQANGTFPVHTVVRWLAPFTGNVKLTGPISLEPRDPAIGDGVYISVWRSGQTTPVWQIDIGPNGTCAPSSGPNPCDGSSPPRFENVPAGGQIYLVVAPRNNADADIVRWSPTFTYDEFTTPPKLEPYGAPIYEFSQQNDFRLAGLPVAAWEANGNGTVELQVFYDKQTTSDNIAFQLDRRPSGTTTPPQDPVVPEEVGADTTGPHFFRRRLDVQKGQKFMLQVVSDTQIDPARVGIKRATMTYISFCRERGRDGQGNPRPAVCGDVVYDPPFPAVPVRAQIQGDTVKLPVSAVLRPIAPHYPPHKTLPNAPTQSFTSPGGIVTITDALASRAGHGLTGGVALIQGVNKLHKRGYVTGGITAVDMGMQIPTTAGEQIFFTILSEVPGVESQVVWTPRINGELVPINRVRNDPNFNAGSNPDPFAGGYHGWYVGDIDGRRPFNQALFTLPRASIFQQRPDFMFCLPFDPMDGTAKGPRFMCRGTNSYVAAGEMAPSFSATGMGSEAQLRAFRLSETANVNLGTNAHVTIAGGNAGTSAGIGVGSTKTTLDFLDLNGDRYPDSVSGGVVLYNTAHIGLDGKPDGTRTFVAGPAIGIGNLRDTSSRNVRGSINIGATDRGHLINLMSAGASPKAVLSTKVGTGVDYGLSSNNVTLEDINGDGLPDQIIANPHNGADTKVRLNLGYRFDEARTWTSTSWTAMNLDSFVPLTELANYLGADVGTQSLSVSDSGSNSASVGGGGQTVDNTFTVGGGVGEVRNTTRTLTRLIDINGDGLLDQVLKRPGDVGQMKVKLNLGTRFAPETSWFLNATWFNPANPEEGLPIVPPASFHYPSSFGFVQNPNTLGYAVEEGWQGSLSVEICFTIFCFGISGFMSGQDGWTQMDFDDIDGDGKPDHVLKINGDPNVYAKLNTIGNMDALQKVTGPLGDTIELSYARAGNHVDAARGVDMPSNHWVLSKVRVGDGRGNFYSDNISYNLFAPTDPTTASIPSGFYDRQEREDYGFGHVEIIRGQFVNGAWSEGDGSQVQRFFYNRDFYRKGRLRAEFMLDGSGNLYQGRRIDVASPPIPSPDTIGKGFFFPNAEDTFSLFYEKQVTFLAIPSELTLSRPAAPKFLHRQRNFDDRGNLINFIDLGDPDGGLNRIDYAITWPGPEEGTNIDRPSEIIATHGPVGPTLRRRAITYLPGKGVPETVTNYVSGGKVPGSGAAGTTYDQASAIYRFTYDGLGNLTSSLDPTGHALLYTYDPSIQTHLHRVDDDAFDLFSMNNYDLRFGAVENTTDTNGQVERRSYDMFGRLCTVRGPDDAAGEPTIAMHYGIVPSSCANPPAAGAPFPAYAVTRHKDVQRAGDPIDMVTFIDGIGRVIQTKKDIDRDATGNGPITTGMTVSGQVLFDLRGRVSSQAQPAFSTAATTTFVAAGIGSNPTTFIHDTLDRQVMVNVPDGTTQGIRTETGYSIVGPSGPDSLGDGRSWLVTQVFDGNSPRVAGPLSNIGRRLTYTDARGNQIAVREFNQIGTATTLTPLTTRYAYDPLDQLRTVTDTKGNETSADYDTVGQMIALTSLDAGQTDFRFDLNGNLKEKWTPLLRAAGPPIRYEHDFNRLKKIDYPNSPDVTYTYGAGSEAGNPAGNLAGRVKQVTYDGGNELRFYDSLGNIRETRTTLNRMSTTTGLPPSITFTMKYAYDWLGRMQSMTYPNWINQSFQILSGEGEKVSYFYDRGGNIDRITGRQQTTPPQAGHPRDFTYLSHVGYDQFGQQTVLTSGNGIANKYLYDPFNRRLTDVQADARGIPFHRLRYGYDKVGNIKTMVNNVSVRPSLNAPVFVGPLDVTYTYDNVYQLRNMSAKYRPHVAYGYEWSDMFTFDEIANIKTKAQTHNRLVWDNQPNTNDTNPVVTQLANSRFDHNTVGLSYSLAYQYNGPRPHGASAINETPGGSSTATPRPYNYDANGNNRGHMFGLNTREQIWDDDNRLKEVKRNNGTIAQFRYDDSGERTKKHIPGSGGGDSWYVNQFFALLPGNRPTKHIYVGETRVATKTDKFDMQTPILSFYHPDHIGTTSYITDKDQNLVQHERYFAYGELWRGSGPQEEALNPSDARQWLFTGKEWDSDTSLYYFGARYLDPHTSVWQSTDPILGSYMQGGPTGGVFSPANIGLYSYAHNNPIVLSDPNGLCVKSGASSQCDPAHVAQQQEGASERAAVRAAAEQAEANRRQFNSLNPAEQETILRNYYGAAYPRTKALDTRSAQAERDMEMVVPIYVFGTTAVVASVAGAVMAGGAAAGAPAGGGSAVGGGAMRRVGDILESVDDVLANPRLLSNLNPADVRLRLTGGIPSGWRVEALGRGAHQGQGFVLRQYTPRGAPTGQQIRWHPGGGHHGPDPYWRVIGSSTKSGIIPAARWPR